MHVFEGESNGWIFQGFSFKIFNFLRDCNLIKYKE
jgi:hypothetical protein